MKSNEVEIIESLILSIWRLGECSNEDVANASVLFDIHRELAPEQYED